MAKQQRSNRQSARTPTATVPANLAPGGSGVVVHSEYHQGVVETRTYASPLMSPADLQRLNEILPNGAQQYFDWVKGQTDHRHQMEEKALAGHLDSEKRGQYIGMFIALLFGIAAFVIGLRGGNEKLAIAFVGAPLVSIVSVFVVGRVMTRNENVTKTKILSGQLSNAKPETP